MDQGFCVDLANQLGKLVGFHFKFKLVSDGRYGRPDPLNGQWDGMIGEVVRGVNKQKNEQVCKKCFKLNFALKMN